MRGTDLDVFYRKLSVQRQLMVVDGKVHLGPSKSAAGVRTLALDEFTDQLLRKQRQWQRERLARTARLPVHPPRWSTGTAGLAPIASSLWSASLGCRRSGCTICDAARPA